MSRPESETADVASAGRIEDHGKADVHTIDQADADRKAYESLRAAAAFRGYTLARSNPVDGPVVFYATRWGLVRELRDLTAAASFVTQIGGGA